MFVLILFLSVLIMIVTSLFVYFRTRNIGVTMVLSGFCSLVITGILLYLSSRDSFYIHSDDRITKFLQTRATDTLHGQGTTVYIVDDFLDPTECNHIIDSPGELVPSPITRPIDDPYFRDSETMFFKENEGVQHTLEQKISDFMGLSEKLGERSQIQHYRLGNQFKAHCDYFDPEDEDVYAEFVGDKGQRTWTFMIYLNDVEGGGHTEFVKLDKKVSPKQGRAVIWNNLHPNGSPNIMTMHRGTPVTAGEKYIITKWFREKNQ